MPKLPVIKLFLFVGLVWAAIVGPLTHVLIMQSIGATSSQIGIFTAICAVVSMVFQPVWGLLSDRLGSPRRVICFCLGVSALFYGSVIFTNSIIIAAVLLIIEAIFRSSIIALLDSYTLSEISTIPRLQYSYIRLAGSIFFGSFSMIYSMIINEWGIKAIIPISTCVCLVAILWGLFASKSQWEKKSQPLDAHDSLKAHTVKHNLKKDVMSLLRNKRYLIFIIHAAFNSLATMPLFIFMVYYVTAVGGSPGDVPMLQAMRCVIEIPFFILIGSLGKFVSAKKLMLAGIGFYFVYTAGLLFSNTLFTLSIFNMIASPGFILCLSGRIRFLNEITPINVRSTSITVMVACEIALGSVLGNLIAGLMLGSFGTQSLAIAALAALCVSVVTLFLIPKKD